MNRGHKVTALSGRLKRPIQSYDRDRTCSVCDTRLSRYNESGTCGVHAGWGGRPGWTAPTVPEA